MVEAKDGETVRRRRVFYIPGYDPFPPRRYRELYRREGAKQADLSGYELRIAPLRDDGPYGWHVDARMQGQHTHTEVRILIWTDIVRRSMDMGVLATYLLLFRTFWIYLSTGALLRLFRLRQGPVIAAMYPVVMLLGQLGLALGAGWAVYRLGGLVVPGWLSGLAGVALVPLVLRQFRRLDGRLFVYYLLHDYAFTAKHRGANPPELEARIAKFVRMITDALQDDVDEVLVVGHSSGAHLGVSIMADVVRTGAPRDDGPALAFLTLGQAVPMQSFLPAATRLRGDLHLLAARDDITWLDVSAPGDGCCYALCDPVAVSGASPPGKRWPLVVSAAFSQTLRPETWKRLKRRFFRLHFQYLCAFDGGGSYDYFAITAGPRSLRARIRGRRPSASRKERVLTPHTARGAP